MSHELFSLEIDDVFLIPGAGTAVTGIVQSGMCRSGEAAVLQIPNGNLETTRLEIDVRHSPGKADGAAYRGEHVGQSQGNIKRADFQGGQTYRKFREGQNCKQSA